VYYRDIQHILGNVITLWFFLCPIVYPVSNVPERFRFTLFLNPVALFTEMYQGLFLSGTLPQLEKFGIVAAFAGVTFVAGSLIFSHYREDFAELI
jgi:ABC-type polysaccharide/polyol phosphate export permease